MDSSLFQYKEKLEQALTLVPDMNAETKVEAVKYWNDLAGQLSHIIHEAVDDNFNPDSMNQEPRIRDSNSSHYSHTAGCQNVTSISTDTSVISTNMGTPNDIDSALISDARLKQDSVGHFHQESLIDKSIYDNRYLNECHLPLIGDHKNQLPGNIEIKIVGDTIVPPQSNVTTSYPMAQAATICATERSPLVSSSCATTRAVPNLTPSDSYILKHQSILDQNSDHHDVAKAVVSLASDLASEIFCSNLDGAQLSPVNHILNYIPNDDIDLSSPILTKVDRASLNTNSECDNHLQADVLGCPRKTAGITHDISNGQFDRGPKLFNQLDGFASFDSTGQIMITESTDGDNFYGTNRGETFTQSERPLQQIQIFNPPTTCDQSNPPYSSLTSNRLKFMFSGNTSTQRTDFNNIQRDLAPISPVIDHQLILSPGTIDDLDRVDIKTESSNHLDLDKVGNNNTNLHTCDVCGKSGFSTKGNLKRHLRAHSGEKPFKCEYCDSCFTEKKSLKIHVRRHTGEKPYKCQICGKLFSQTGVLQSHMALHLNERKFECQKCGKAFRQRSQLKLHLMRHDGVKRLECSTCAAKFLTKGDLERHCRIHTGERPYACNICSKTFTRQQSLNEHMNRHTGRKPYDCKFCDKTFSEMSACYKHAKVHKKQDQLQQRSTDNQPQALS